jgi:TPR repeat protein
VSKRVASGWLVMAVVVAGAALAGPLEDGLYYARVGDYPEALRLLTPLGERGNPEAAFALALLYQNGRGVRADAAVAAKWYRLAADQGIQEAQNNLGLLYARGDGVPKDAGEAIRWWTRAAQQGYVRAQTNLARIYFEGDGVPRDFVQAYKWASLANAKSDQDAAFILDSVQPLMSAADIAEAERQVRAWRPSLVERL